jgi:hypothetical protein
MKQFNLIKTGRAPCESIRWIRFRSDRTCQTTIARFAGARPQPFLVCKREAKPHALASESGDDDAFGRGTHGTSEGTQVEAWFILLKKREDHWSVAVRAKRTLIGSFAVEKRRNGAVKHRRLLD